MSTRIAHLSDLHYGGRGFDRAQWQAVAKVVADLRPNLIIVSGDLVDHPILSHLEAAKAELVKLSQAANAQLFVVPGNHDVFAFGTDVGQQRSDLFEQVFADLGLSKTDGVEVNDLAITRSTDGLRENSARFFRLRGLFWRRHGNDGRDDPARLSEVPQLQGRKLTRHTEGTSVLLALLDSNAGDQTIAFAGGSVRNDDLIALSTELSAIDRPYLARIAVVHHHVLPIAHTSGKIIGAEALMVLQNAGTVLSVLAHHRFDLVLHGHKHKPQFARIDLDPATTEGYPISVAAAGSAALVTRNDPRGNCFNLIDVEDNGRIVVRSLFYGDGEAPDPHGREGVHVRTYSEPISVVKRRAFVRASERHRIRCDRRELLFEVTENGDLLITHRITGLRLVGSNAPYNRRKHDVFVAKHGRVVIDLELDEESIQRGYRIERDPKSTPPITWVVLTESLGGSKAATYGVRHAGANCMVMTPWEAEERARTAEDQREEWVATCVYHPVRQMVIDLKLADSLRHVQPYLRCERCDKFPGYDVDTDLGDATLSPDTVWITDSEMGDEEETRLRYLASEDIWRLTIEQPMVGYRYQLRWRTPGTKPHEPIPSETLQWQDSLLQMGKRVACGKPAEADRKAEEVFDILCEALEKLLRWGDYDEKRILALFVYDRHKLALWPVLSRQSWSTERVPTNFEIPLGEGIAGAAFQQRRIVPWTETSAGSPFIKPVDYPQGAEGAAIRMRAHLAVPVYHASVQDEPRPSPWSAIGVVSFSSSSFAPKIAALCNPSLDDASKDMVREVRALAQSHVVAILDAVAAG